MIRLPVSHFHRNGNNIDYTHLKKDTFKKHIDLFGEIIFEKEE